jgi:hypothetical protein
MTSRPDLVTSLRALARRTRDLARADAAGAAALRPDFDRALIAAGRDDPTAATPEGHARAIELYPLVIPVEAEAKAWLEDADRFEEAARAVEALREIADMEGRKGMSDYKFAERAVALAAPFCVKGE